MTYAYSWIYMDVAELLRTHAEHAAWSRTGEYTRVAIRDLDDSMEKYLGIGRRE